MLAPVLLPGTPAVPWLAGELMLQVSVSLSASVACKVRARHLGSYFAHSHRSRIPSVITGGVLIVTFTVMVSVPPLLSSTFTTNELVPV